MSFITGFYPPPPHCVVLTPVSGGESGCSIIAGDCGYNFIAPADCPSETGGRGAKRRRGWIKPLTTTYYLSTPSPLRGTPPVSGGESGCSVIAGTLWLQFHIATAGCPPETGGRGVKRRRGWIRQLTTTYYLSTPSPLRGTPPVSGGERGCSAIARTLSPLFPVVTIPLSCRGVREESGLQRG